MDEKEKEPSDLEEIAKGESPENRAPRARKQWGSKRQTEVVSIRKDSDLIFSSGDKLQPKDIIIEDSP